MVCHIYRCHPTYLKMTPRPNIILLLVPARRYGVVGGQMLLVAEQNTGESASATGTAAGGACSSSRETCMSVPMHAAHDKNTQAAVYRRHVAFLRGNSRPTSTSREGRGRGRQSRRAEAAAAADTEAEMRRRLQLGRSISIQPSTGASTSSSKIFQVRYFFCHYCLYSVLDRATTNAMSLIVLYGLWCDVQVNFRHTHSTGSFRYSRNTLLLNVVEQ